MALAKKFLNVMKACRVLSCDSNNTEVGYKYVSAAKLNAAVNKALVENGIISLASSRVIDTCSVETKGGEETLAVVEVEITLVDTESDETFKIRGAGSGIDAGDKAIAKAQTMAVKYAWKNSVLIADYDDDPDANKNTSAYADTSFNDLPF